MLISGPLDVSSRDPLWSPERRATPKFVASASRTEPPSTDWGVGALGEVFFKRLAAGMI